MYCKLIWESITLWNIYLYIVNHRHQPVDHNDVFCFHNTYRRTYIIWHYSEAIMGAMASQFTVVSIVYSTVSSGVGHRKHHSSASLALCGEFTNGRWIPLKLPATRKMFPFDDVILDLAVGDIVIMKKIIKGICSKSFNLVLSDTLSRWILSNFSKGLCISRHVSQQYHNDPIATIRTQ